MVNYLDDMVGQVVAALKKKGMWDNLLWTTNSDNVSHDLFSKENNEYMCFHALIVTYSRRPLLSGSKYRFKLTHFALYSL